MYKNMFDMNNREFSQYLDGQRIYQMGQALPSDADNCQQQGYYVQRERSTGQAIPAEFRKPEEYASPFSGRSSSASISKPKPEPVKPRQPHEPTKQQLLKIRTAENVILGFEARSSITVIDTLIAQATSSPWMSRGEKALIAMQYRNAAEAFQSRSAVPSRVTLATEKVRRKPKSDWNRATKDFLKVSLAEGVEATYRQKQALAQEVAMIMGRSVMMSGLDAPCHPRRR